VTRIVVDAPHVDVDDVAASLGRRIARVHQLYESEPQ
jgi:hypothetical protein